MAATILTVTDLAAKLDTDPRTARKFLRTITPLDAQPGKGSRWGIPATQVRSMQSKFKKFQAEAEAAKAPEPTPAEEAAHDAEVDQSIADHEVAIANDEA